MLSLFHHLLWLRLVMLATWVTSKLMNPEKAQFEFTDAQLKLSGEHSIVGRSVVVHAGVDDLGRGGFDDSKTTGHAGGRVACGVIGVTQ